MSSQKQVKVTLPEGFKADNVRVENGFLTYDLVEEKFEPKDGDFVFMRNLDYNDCTVIAVFKGYTEAKMDCYFCYTSFLDCFDINDGINNESYLKNIRCATEEEKQLLLDKLDENGYEWDSENKEVLKKLWRAEEGDEYWCIKYDYTFNLIDDRSSLDNSSYDSGNYFQTKEEAEAFLPKVIELFKQRRKL